jgi:hypothetical protein
MSMEDVIRWLQDFFATEDPANRRTIAANCLRGQLENLSTDDEFNRVVDMSFGFFNLLYNNKFEDSDVVLALAHQFRLSLVEVDNLLGGRWGQERLAAAMRQAGLLK